MFRKILLVLLCLALLTVTACAPAAQPVVSPSAEAEATPAPSAETAAAPDESAEPAPTAETGSIDQALLSDVLMQTENFSVLLMQNLMNANTEQNSAFSPLALNAVMAALYAGAKGDTEEEMRLLMGYQTEPGDVVQALTYLISAQDSNAFTLGDSLHLSRRVGFVENYIDQITAPLRIGTYSQDYSDPATYQSVNACAELVTNGKVSTLLDSTVAADTLYLISAFQLSAAFDLPFDPARTQAGTFEGTTGLISVPMMAGDFEANYAEDEYMQMVSLPLAEGKMQLKLILPREGGESAFAEALPQYADAWLSPEAVSTQSVTLHVPKFTLSCGDSYLEALSSMGLEKALRAQTADFSGMLNPDLVLPTPINDVFSVCSLTLSENGLNTDAQPALQTAEPSEENIDLEFDHPFLMAVTDTQTGALLTLAWVNVTGDGR